MASSSFADSYHTRRADNNDIGRLVDLRLEFLEEVNGSPAPDGLRESLQEYLRTALPAGEFLAWLAMMNNEIVGTSGLVFMKRPPSHSNLNGRDAYIMNMYTLPAWRGRGIGTALFEQLLEHIQTTDSGKVFLHATEQGRPLYEKFGFFVPDGEVEMILKL